MKKLTDYFEGYDITENLNYAVILNVEVTEGDNSNDKGLYLEIESDAPISMKECLSLKKQIHEKENRKLDLKIKYKNDLKYNASDIIPLWEDILSYIVMDIPFGDAMLKGSFLDEKSPDCLNLNVKIDIIDYLKELNLDKKISKLLKELVGYETSIEFKFAETSNSDKDDKNQKIINSEIKEIKEVEIEEEKEKTNKEEKKKEVQEKDRNKNKNKNIKIEEKNQVKAEKNINIDQNIKIEQDINRDPFAEFTEKQSEIFDNHMQNAKPKAKEKKALVYEKKSPGIKLDTATNTIKIKTRKKRVIKEKKAEITLPKTGLICGRNWSNNKNISIHKVKEITEESGNVQIIGEIIEVEERFIEKNKSTLFTVSVYDGTSAIYVKIFVNENKTPLAKEYLKKGQGVKVFGQVTFDRFTRDLVIMADSIFTENLPPKRKKVDTAEEKRVELRCHTKMSMLEGVIEPKDLIKRAKDYGMTAIGITDDAGVQVFPTINNIVRDMDDFKVLYGLDGFLVNDSEEAIFNYNGQKLKDTEYCVFDIETTGLSYLTDKITEIGVIKIKNGEIIDTYETFVNPEKPIPPEVVRLTGITDEMVKDAPKIDVVIKEVLEFFGDSILVAHNADFDIGFLNHIADEENLKFEFTYIDTLRLAKTLFTELHRFRLEGIARHLGIEVIVAHRALDDVKTLVQVFNKMIEMLVVKDIKYWDQINEKYDIDEDNYKKLRMHDITIFAKDYLGLKNLYRLVSISHVEYFYQRPRILRSILNEYREGLLLGSGGIDGEVYSAALSGRTKDDLKEIIEYYDFIEVVPFANAYKLYKNERLKDRSQWNEINQLIIDVAEDLGKIVVATGDVYLLDPEDKIYRQIIQTGKKRRDAHLQPDVYFRTTNEMLEEFNYLGQEKSYEIVVKNTNKIANMIEKIEPISRLKCTPEIEGSDKEIRDITYGKAYELYGRPLPDIVEKRLEKELTSIISNGFAVLYMLAEKLVKKSNEDGYMVGSRGSVGSSLVAYMLGVSEINSLPPHYRCPKCKHSDFNIGTTANGFDLEDKKCEICDTDYIKDGMNIPFETFLGFKGDKEPDIDLNFSSEYQARAHRYTLEIIGDGETYKAGTIGTIADKTAFGYTRAFFEEKGIHVNKAEISRISKGCVNVKATTGQHPGGIIVLPAGHEINEFTPVQKPADKADSDIITTHFDYHAIEHNLLKLDLLGHDNPTILKMLHDLTGVDPETIPMDEEKTMSIFSSMKALEIDEKAFPLSIVKKDFDGNPITDDVGTNGIPEFGTGFVQQMLRETRPTTFDELIRISGLSHGTDVWVGNAQELVSSGIATLSEAICTRDDIMTYLISKGLPEQDSFTIMEKVRKGRGLTEDEEELMKANNVPDWYIESCKRIKYMFPKAHAAAYVTAAFRIAWYKVYYPTEYYAVFLSIKGADFDALKMSRSYLDTIENYQALLSQHKLSDKEKNMASIYELVIEMYRRGITFDSLDLYKSDSKNFLISGEKKIRIPYNSIPGLGDIAAKTLYDAAQEREFKTKDEIRERGKVGDSIIELLDEIGATEGIPESNQISFFDDFM